MIRNTRENLRGVALLEFALSVPLMLVLVFLTVDVGKIVMASTALHEAVTVGARAGARTGFVGGVPGNCSDPRITGNTSYDAFCEVARNIPGARVGGVVISSPSTGGANNRYCQNNAGASNLYVTMTASITSLSLLTPGLSGMLESLNNTSLPGTLTATGTARCEVARA